ncbi:hypothetical protein [Flavobacterium rivuli]|nr:hypothetical protein [Flavobacterium rivuli]
MKKLFTMALLICLFACTTKTETPNGDVTKTGEPTIPVTNNNDTGNDEAITMLNSFYKEYVTAFADTTHTSAQQTDAVIKKYCTPQLTKKIAEASLDSDPFINAQDGDISILKTLTIKHTKKDIYKACYTESYSNTTNCTDVTVSKIGDAYKISHVVLIEL